MGSENEREKATRAAMDRLREERPDLIAQIIFGGLTIDDAMVIAGFREGAAPVTVRPITIKIPVTETVMEAAEELRQRLTQRQWDELFHSMLHLASMERTDAAGGTKEQP